MGKSRKRVPVSTCCCCKSQKRGKQFSHRRFRRCERMLIKSGETFLPIKQYELTNQWDLGGDGMLQMAWEIGQYISARIKSAGWGAKVVDELSEYLQQQEPGSREFGRRNLYNMVTFYDKYSTPEFCEIAKSLTNSLFVQRKTQSEFVQMSSAQMEFTPLPSENVESKHILKE